MRASLMIFVIGTKSVNSNSKMNNFTRVGTVRKRSAVTQTYHQLGMLSLDYFLIRMVEIFENLKQNDKVF